MHSEKFWRENARALEAEDFGLLKRLIALLRAGDAEVVSIACYDIGESFFAAARGGGGRGLQRARAPARRGGREGEGGEAEPPPLRASLALDPVLASSSSLLAQASGCASTRRARPS